MQFAPKKTHDEICIGENGGQKLENYKSLYYTLHYIIS
jgi:hypothetical protein